MHFMIILEDSGEVVMVLTWSNKIKLKYSFSSMGSAGVGQWDLIAGSPRGHGSAPAYGSPAHGSPSVIPRGAVVC